MSTWVFGYGSLVAPASLARTIGRTVRIGDDAFVATLAGYGRRWNYGSETLRGDWTAPDGRAVSGGVVVSLGVVAAADESIDGVIARLDADELARLDWRERAYERVDVSDLVTVLDDPVAPTTPRHVELYVPRPHAVARYLRHRDDGTAAVRRDYHELVDGAFAALGPAHHERYRATPPPDVPIVDVDLTPPADRVR